MSSSVQLLSGKTRKVLAHVLAAVKEVPQLGALVFGVPLAVAVAMRKEAFLGARLFLVAAGAAEGSVKAELGQGVEQGDRLQPVARGVGAVFFDHAAAVDRVLDVADDQLDIVAFRQVIAEVERFLEVVARVDMQQREGDAAGGEGAARQLDHDNRVLAAGEEQDRAFKLRGHFAHDKDGFGFQLHKVSALLPVHNREFPFYASAIRRWASWVISSCRPARSRLSASLSTRLYQKRWRRRNEGTRWASTGRRDCA